jgi:hypothetical protein
MATEAVNRETEPLNHLPPEVFVVNSLVILSLSPQLPTFPTCSAISWAFPSAASRPGPPYRSAGLLEDDPDFSGLGHHLFQAESEMSRRSMPVRCNPTPLQTLISS